MLDAALRRASVLSAVAAAAVLTLFGTLFVAPAAYAADTTPPGKPSSIGATYYGGIGTVLTWGKVSASDLAGYRVYRSSASSMSAKVLVADTTSTTASDATAVAGTTYYYAVTSYDTTGNESATSSTKSVKATDTKKPANPGSLKASVSDAGIALDWKDNAEVDLGGYEVLRGSSSSGPWSVLADDLSESAFLDETAPVGVKQYYRVTAHDQVGNESGYASANATRTGTAPALQAPATPAGLGAQLVSGVPTLTWRASTGATGYTLSRAVGADGAFTVVAQGITALTYRDGAAPAGGTVRYALVAVNAAGSSSAATVSIDVPRDEKPPATPRSPKATVVPNGGMQVSWSANTEADLAGYLVLKRDKARGGYFPYLGSVDAPYPLTSFTDASVIEGTVGYFRIEAVDTSGNVSDAYVAVTANNPNVKPGAPKSLKVTRDPEAGLALTWTAPADADVAGYTIMRSTSSSTGWALLDNVLVDAVGASPSFRDTSAPTGITVYYRVSAIDAVGNVSSFSSTVSGMSLTQPIPLQFEETVLTVGPDKAFPTIGEALATIPRNNLRRYRVDIDPGTYGEVLRLRSPYVTLNGTGAAPADTVIASAQASGSPDPDEPGETLGTSGSYVVFVDPDANDVTLRNLTVANTFDEAGHPEIADQQAVALRVEGDRFVGNRIRVLGNQDTLLADTPRPTARVRQYYVDSYIEGDVDYVFGAANAVFDRVTFRSLDRSKSNNGYVTAASTDEGSKYGFLIWDGKIVSDAAAGTVNLGRPWHPSADPKARGSVVLVNTWLDDAIDTAAPWDEMTTRNSSGTPVLFPWTTGRFSEYGSTGPGAATAASEMRPQLTDKDAAKLTPAIQLAGSDGWNPVVAASNEAPATVQGLQAATDRRLVTLAWTGDESASVTTWNVYRAPQDGPFALVGTTHDVTWADTGVTTGAAYRYVVTAVSRSGLESTPSEEVAVTVTEASHAADVVVDPAAPPSATSFTTLADALAAAPAGTPVDPTVIELAPGRYEEYVTVAKPYTIVRGRTGEDPRATVIAGDRAAGTPTGEVLDGVAQTFGTSGSATLVVTGNNVSLVNLTVANEYVEGTYPNGQAVALRTTGDRIRLEQVRLLGNQDTFYANSTGREVPARVYVYDSYIEGDVDFVFGRATVVIDRSTLHVLDHGTTPNGAVTAASTNEGNPFGFLLTGSRIIGDAPDGSQNLGRPWQPGIAQEDGTSLRDESAIAQVVVRDTWLGPVVSSTAWTDMVNSGVTTRWQDARFAEYRNAGPGADVGADRAQLTDADAEGYTAQRYLAGSDGWDPVADPAEDVAPQPVAGLTATGGDRRIALDWADSPEVDAVRYLVYAADQAGFQPTEATLVAEVTSSRFLETTASNGVTRYYRVVAVDLAGNRSDVSAEVSATSIVPPLVADLTVAADGSGDFTSLQQALTAIPAGTAAAPKVIVVEPGTYREVVTSAKSYVSIVGSTGDARDVVVVFGNASGTAAGSSTCPGVTTATCGTGGSATVALSGAGVQVRDLTIANDFDRAAHPEITNTQAVALRATGDRQVYTGVRLLGNQDTLNADASGNISADGTGYPRQYYADSYIEGDVDFVFGRASAVFERVSFHALARTGGVVFAPSTASRAKGYLVVDSRFTSDNDPGGFYLGRPWRGWSDGATNDDSRGQVLIRDSYVAAGFASTHPWTDMSPLVWTDGRFGEYRNAGPGVTVSADRPLLDDEAAAAATPAAWLAGSDGWSPDVAVPDRAPRTPSTPTARAESGRVTLDWSDSLESSVRGYEVLRDGEVLATTDVSSYVDDAVTDGVEYTYAVRALDLAGRVSPSSAVVTATPTLAVDATVAADGSGDYTTLAQALTAASPGWVIQLAPGTYPGTTSVTKAVTIVGTGARDAVVLTNATSTATLTVSASGVTVSGLTIENTSTSGNAPALAMTGDKVLVRDAVLRSSANRTVFADTATYTAAARQLITGSTLVGGSDIVLGRATLVIHDTLVQPRTNGTILTPSTAADRQGFLLIDSTVDTTGVTNVQLGRPYRAWADTFTPRSVGQAVVRDTELGSGLRTAGVWGVGPAGEAASLGRFAEFRNTGDGAQVTDTRPQLTPIQSLDVSVAAWLGAPTWYPTIADPAAPEDAVAPEPVSGLTVAAADASARLTWAASASSDVAAYRVYRQAGSDVSIGASTLVATVTGTEHVDTGLANATAYTWAVVAVDAAGNASSATTAHGTPLDAVAPATPTGLRAVGAHERVTLSWDAGAEADLTDYVVYRDGVQVGVVPAGAAPTFTDTGLVNGTDYAYGVAARDASGLVSEQALVTGRPTEGDAEPPAAPTGVTTVLGRARVDVVWPASPESDVVAYQVLRDGELVGTSAAPSFTDTSVALGTTYSYAVVAVDGSGNASPASDPASATPIAVDYVVAADGSGDATTLQDVLGQVTAAGALDTAAPGLLANNADFATQGYRTILVRPGTYTGPVVSGNRYGVRVVGASSDASDVVLTAPGGSVATFAISGNEWTLRDLTLESVAASPGAQATALQVKSGDKVVVDGARLLGDAKAVQVSTANATTYSRVFITDSYLQGGADLLIGRAVTVVADSTIHVLNRPGASITDSAINVAHPFGFLISGTEITSDAAAGTIALGRPYPESGTTSSQVVVRDSVLPAAVNTGQPWKDWSATVPWTSGRFFEYANTGPGAGTGETRPQLTPEQAAGYTIATYLAGTDGWNPQ